MHAQHAGLRPLAQRHHVVVGAGGTQMDAVALGSDILQRPDLAVEFGALLQVAHAKLDAAQSVDFLAWFMVRSPRSAGGPA